MVRRSKRVAQLYREPPKQIYAQYFRWIAYRIKNEEKKETCYVAAAPAIVGARWHITNGKILCAQSKSFMQMGCECTQNQHNTWCERRRWVRVEDREEERVNNEQI